MPNTSKKNIQKTKKDKTINKDINKSITETKNKITIPKLNKSQITYIALVALLFILIITLITTIIYIKTHPRKRSYAHNKTIEGSVLPCGYLNEDIDYSNIIKSYEELETYVNKYDNIRLEILLSLYTPSFFETQNLALKYIPVASSQSTIKLDKVIIDKKTVIFKYTLNYPENPMLDMYGYLLVAPIDNNIQYIK